MSKCLRGSHMLIRNPLCEQQIRILKENVMIWCNTTKDTPRSVELHNLCVVGMQFICPSTAEQMHTGLQLSPCSPNSVLLRVVKNEGT